MIQAYIRLLRMREKRNDLDTFMNDVYNAIEVRTGNDEAMAKCLRELSLKFEENVSLKKQVREEQFLNSERAHDIIKVNLI